MLSDKATAGDFLQFIDLLKEYSRIHIVVSNDDEKCAEYCLDLLFKTPMIPERSLIISAQNLYNHCLDAINILDDCISNSYNDYDLSCPGTLSDDAITKLTKTKEDIDSMVSQQRIINSLIKSIEKIFGFSVGTRYDCPI